MATIPTADALTAQDVARGVARWFHAHDIACLTEVPLRSGRRADLLGIGADGRITLVEVKVAMADLRGDLKWPEYLDFCDRFFWAIPLGFPVAPFDEPWFQPDRAGLLVADRWDAAQLRDAAWAPMNATRRKAEMLRFARRAAGRLLGLGELSEPAI
jgi:hypothetical protein